MVFIRPVAADDLDPLLDLAGLAGVGLTTLPNDRDVLRKRILKSVRSFEQVADRPGGETYLFVMQDVDSGKVVGASGTVSKVGGFEPFYAYRIEKELLRSNPLGVRHEIASLHLVRDHDGPAEIGSLFLAPDYRKTDNGRFLQLVRFLFMAQRPSAFEPLVVSEMRGVIDAGGRSAFWDAVGRHFFQIDFPRADYLSVVNKKFIADLMPKHPIYVPLLPPAAQDVIGQVHEQSKPALKNLQAEGFGFSGMVDIFDAGACVSCARDEIRTVRECRTAVVTDVSDTPAATPTHMIATCGGPFLACVGPVSDAPAGVRIGSGCARVLNVGVGANVCYSPLRPAAACRRRVGPAVFRNGHRGRRMSDMPSHHFAGRWIDGEGPPFTSTDPATGDINWQGRAATDAEIDRAVAAARDAFAQWADVSPADRIAFVEAVAEQYRRLKPELARAVCARPANPGGKRRRKSTS